MTRNFRISPGKSLSIACAIVASLFSVTSNALAATCSPPPPGIVGWWPGEGNANDSIGTSHGTLAGGAVFTTGKVGQGFRLDGTNAYVQIPDSSALKPTNVTVEAWVWLDPNVPRSMEYILFKKNTQSSLFEGYSLNTEARPNGSGTNVERFAFGVARSGSQVIAYSTTAVQRGVWYHVAGTFDGVQSKIWVNGVAEMTVIPGFQLDFGTRPVFIGTTGESFDAKLAGIIDEPSIYNRALSASEILGLYNAGSAGKCASTSAALPAIASFAPAAGTTGTAVSITGTNFSATAAANIVYFGAVQAQVLAASPTSLTVMVPTGATFAPITVTVNGLTAYAKQPFLPTFPGNGQITNSSLAARLDLPVGAGPIQVVTTDLDGDGKPDLIVANASVGKFSIYQNISTNGSLAAGSFAARVDVPVLPSSGTSPYVIGAADLDGDGRPDVMTLSADSNMISIFRNVSTPGILTTNSFAARMDIPAGNVLRGLAVQDLNGDGKPEMVTVNQTSPGSISIFQNLSTSGNLSFAARVDFAVGNIPQGLAIGDLDGDGQPDIAVANYSSSTISVFRNAGIGGNITTNAFAPRVDLPALATVGSLVIGDLDGDGKLDLVAGAGSASGSQAISVYRNTSTAGSLTLSSFAARVDFAAGWVNTLALADLDGDGKLDIALASQVPSTFSIFKNISVPGSFTATSLGSRVDYSAGYNPGGLAIDDLDGDGRPDIAFGNFYDGTISIYRNQTPLVVVTPPVANPPIIAGLLPTIGNVGTFATITGTNFSATLASNIVYFGAVRAVVSAASSTSLTVTVPVGATFAPVTVTVGGLSASSTQPFEPTFNGDGSSISNSSFAASFNLGTGGGPGSAVIADLDGDGKPDVALVSGDAHTVSIFRNLGTNGTALNAASFALRVDLPIPPTNSGDSPYRLRAVDVDGDGKLDLIACGVNGNQVSILHNVATPGSLTTNSFEAPVALTAGNDCRFATAADLDGDGRLDIIALNYADNTLSIFRNIGAAGNLSTNSFAAPLTLATPAGPYEVAIGDLDGDGKPDLALASSSSTVISVFRNTATPGTLNAGSFAPRVDFPALSNGDTIVLGDLDGDGKLDVVAGFVNPQIVSVYRNLSTPGVFTTNSLAAPVNVSTPGWMHTVTLADFNGDGKPDICVVGELDSYLAFFQNTSTPGSFTSASLAPRVDFGTGWNAWGVAAGDLNGDGRPDVVFGNAYDANIQFYQNVMPFGSVNPPALTNPPLITAVAPGTAAPGTAVTISGLRFSSVAASNIVYFGAVRAAVSSASPTSLTVTVPLGATFAPITVTVNGLVASSAFAFAPTFTGNGAAIDAATFAPGVNLNIASPITTVIADLNGDGKPDLTVANVYANSISLLQNIGSTGVLNATSFAAPVVYSVGSGSDNPIGVSVADVDGDGWLDLLVADRNNNQIVVYRNISAGGTLTTNSFAPPVFFAVAADPRRLVVCDLDGDGRPDIISANGSGSVSILRNLGAAGSITAGSFAPHVDLAMAGSSEFVAAGDLDGDSKPDLAAADSSGFISLFRNHATPGNLGTNAFDARVDLPAQSGSLNVVIGDLDGDGRPELITSAYLPQTMSVYRNLSAPGSLNTSSFAAPVDYALAGRGHTIALNDLNGDGKPDIAEVTELDSALSLFQNIGAGNFTNSSLAARVDYAAGWNAWGVAVGDLDGDGRPDAVFANSYDNTLTLYKNQIPFGTNTPPFCPTLLSGLVGWWKGDGNTLDSAGTNNGVNQNITYTTGVVGQAFACDPENYSYGTYTGVQIPDQPAYALTNSLTIEGWVRPRGDGYIIFFRGDHRPGTDPYFLSMNGNHDLVFYIGDEDGHGTNVQASLAYNQWTHLAATLDGTSGTMSLFTNGVLAANIVTTLRPFGTLDPGQSPGIGIGNLNDGGNNFPFYGDIDEISLYSRALAATEIQAIYNAGSLGKCTNMSACASVTLVNVDFGAGTNTTKVGLAAAGLGTNDFWNFYTRDDGAGGWRTLGSVINLRNFDGSVTTAGLTVNNAPGAWGNGSSDAMLDVYIYPFNNGNVTVTITNLPAGQYDVLPYSGNGNFDVSSAGVSYGPKTCYANPIVNPPVWQEGVQYVRFTNVVVSAGQPLVLTVHPGVGDAALIAGLQIALSSYTNALPPSSIAPFITVQPTNVTELAGNPATFNVTAQGTGPLTFQWRFNGTNIAGATDATLTLSNLQLALSGSYSVVVSNGLGTATSSNAVLEVLSAPVILAQTPSQVVLLGLPATFSANAGGTDPLSYFWSRNNVLIPGATNSSYTLGSAQLSDSGSKFSCLVTNAYGFAASTNAALKVIDSISNDLCSGAIVVTGFNYTNLQSTAKATSFGDPVPGCVDGFGNGVWYQFTAPVSGLLLVDTFGSDFDTGLAIYTGACGALAEVACDDDTGGMTSQATLPTTAGTTYSILVGGYGAHTGNLVFHLTHLTPPAFVVQPATQSVLVNSNVSFSATLTGALPMTFQWFFNGAPLVDDGRIVGSTTASLSISNLSTADAGSYTLSATNFLGSADSTAAGLTVLVPPSITLNPIGRSVPPGLPTTINAAASGIPAPTYQWQFNGTNIPGATSAAYAIGAVNTNHLGFYHLFASNSVGTAVSADAQLTFGPVAAWGRNLNNESLPPPGLSNVVSVAGSFQASFALRADGTITAWGGTAATNTPANASNVVAMATSGNMQHYALRANGTVVSWNGNLTVPALSNIVAVAAGNTPTQFGIALRAEGSLVGWGQIPYSTIPAGLNHVTTIAAGYSHSLALKDDGTVVSWGSGPGTNVPTGLANVTAIAAGYTHSLALKSNGTVVAWGSDTGTNLPAGLTNIVAISTESYPASQNLSLALRADGTVAAWGISSYGEAIPPKALSNLLSVAVAAAPYHSLALVNDGRPVILHPPIGLTAFIGRDVTLRGDAVGAQPLSYQWLLNGTNLPGATSPSLVLPNLKFANAGNYQLFVSNSISTALSLSAPLTVVSNNTLVVLSQTSASPTNVYQGGKFTVSGPTVLGNGPLRYQWFFSRTNNNYAAISGATNDTLTMEPALALHTGNYYVAVSNQFAGLTSAPVAVRVLFAKAWGYLATDPPTSLNVTNATAIAVGNAGLGSSLGHYLVLKSDGKISSWTVATSGYGETNFTALSNSIVTAIAAGYQDSLALKSDGTLFTAGYNVYGETNVPPGLSGVTAIACGDYHDLALKVDGTLTGWGQNTYQQTTNVAATNVVAIAAGSQNSMALRADGSVVNWGFFSPQIPSNVTNIIAIACGVQHFLALRANGTVVGWGNNNYGQITVATNLTNIVAIAAAANHSTLLRNDGTVVTLGAYNGQTTLTAPADLANVIAIADGGDHDLALFGTRAPAFTVQPWNRAIAVTARTNILLAAKCAGVQPMSYQWLLNGTNLPGATSDSLILTNQPSPQFGTVRFLPAGSYQLMASNAYGVAISKPAKITAFYPLGDALDATNLNWTTTGAAPWFGQTNITHDGVDAVRSGGIGALQETILQTTVGTNYAGRYTFWWKVSSEQFFDTLEFRVNGTVQASLSGEVNWQQASIPVAAGTNVLQWRYSKDGSFDVGLDAAFVDQFAFIADGPTIILQPLSQTVNMGTNVTFRVVSTPGKLSYQWRKDGIVTGSNSDTLVLPNVGRAQNGTYTVTVTDFGIGSTVSSNAVLKVLVPQKLGAPTLLPDGTLQFSSTDANGGLLSPSDLANFEAQASTNLLDWVTLPNALSLTNGMLRLQDSGQSNYNARYYRLLEH